MAVPYDSPTGTLDIVAVGWPFVTPRYNHFKQFLHINRCVINLRCIVFPKRLIDSIHGVPIIDYEELEMLTAIDQQCFVLMTINAAIEAQARAIVEKWGGRIVTAAEVVTRLLHGNDASLHTLSSPFPAISFSSIKSIVAEDHASVLQRILELRGLSNYEIVRTAFAESRWDLLFDVQISYSVDEWVSKCIEYCSKRGVGSFVFEDVASPYLDVVMQDAAISESSDYCAFLRAPERVRGIEFFQLVMGSRLIINGEYPSVPSCVFASDVKAIETAFAKLGPSSASSFALLHAKRSLADVAAMASWLGRTGLRHRLLLEPCSVDPSELYVLMVPA